MTLSSSQTDCLSLSLSLSACLSACLSLLQFIPESARYNVSAGNIQAAVETLQKIAKMNGACLPAGRLVEPAVVRSLWGSTSAARCSFMFSLLNCTLLLLSWWIRYNKAELMCSCCFRKSEAVGGFCSAHHSGGRLCCSGIHGNVSLHPHFYFSDDLVLS